MENLEEKKEELKKTFNLNAFIQEQELPVSLPSDSSMLTLQLHQQGLNVENIAQQRRLAVSTIYGHLCDLIVTHQPVEIDRLVSTDKKKAITQAIGELTDTSLKVLKEHLGDGYSYEEIKLVRSWLQAKLK